MIYKLGLYGIVDGDSGLICCRTLKRVPRRIEKAKVASINPKVSLWLDSLLRKI